LSRIFKRIITEIGTEAGIEVIRGYILERLRLVSPTDLYKAIKDGTHTMGVTEAKDRNFGRKWVRVINRLKIDGKRLQKEDLTASNVLEWLKVDRPDLASLIINVGPPGMEWLKKDVEEIYKFLFIPKEQPPTPTKPQVTLIKHGHS
jgi:hypothetical protein